MDWASTWLDIGGGLLIAGALAAWVPQASGRHFFFMGIQYWRSSGDRIGPLVAILSFVCSVGNVPLAAVLWNGGISFGGVVAFLFADLIILRILNIYRKYYALKISLLLLALFYASMSLAALAVEYVFGLLHLIPVQQHAQITETAIRWNYTTALNIVFLVFAILLVVRFLRTGGPAMLRMMNTHPGGQDHGMHTG